MVLSFKITVTFDILNVLRRLKQNFERPDNTEQSLTSQNLHWLQTVNDYKAQIHKKTLFPFDIFVHFFQVYLFKKVGLSSYDL